MMTDNFNHNYVAAEFWNNLGKNEGCDLMGVEMGVVSLYVGVAIC